MSGDWINTPHDDLISVVTFLPLGHGNVLLLYPDVLQCLRYVCHQRCCAVERELLLLPEHLLLHVLAQILESKCPSIFTM
jgi:hypothetical protein